MNVMVGLMSDAVSSKYLYHVLGIIRKRAAIKATVNSFTGKTMRLKLTFLYMESNAFRPFSDCDPASGYSLEL